MKPIVYLLPAFIVFFSYESFCQKKLIPKPSLVETKRWITEKISLYSQGFKSIQEVRNPGVILGDIITAVEVNKVTHTQSNLIFELKQTTNLKNCCQETSTNTTVTVTIPWAIFRSETDVKFFDKDSLTTGNLFIPSADYALMFQSDGNQIDYSSAITQVVHKTLSIRTGAVENTEEYTRPANSLNTNIVSISINLMGESKLKERLLKAFADLYQYNKSKKETY